MFFKRVYSGLLKGSYVFLGRIEFVLKGSLERRLTLRLRWLWRRVSSIGQFADSMLEIEVFLRDLVCKSLCID